MIDLTPKLVTVLREGYRASTFRDDALAGLTVAIVALPLSMAIAVASGLSPEKGLIAAIVGGVIISAFGGSRHQIGGPAGAFIVVVALIVERHGHEGLLLAMIMAGAMMMAAGALRLGTLVNYVPYPVIIGFTAGIATIIAASQLREFLGLAVEREPAALLPKLEVLAGALPTAQPATLAVAALALGIILALRRLRPRWPGFLIAVAVTALAGAWLELDVATVGSRFGALPRVLPPPAVPPCSLEAARAVLPDAITIAVLGSIEALLSAVVADGMTGRRHRANAELLAQGSANVAVAIFGGMPATGTIARTATNVRAGGKTPVSGVLHAVYLLVFMAAAAPLAAHIPLATLAAILLVVAWNMAERHAFAGLLRGSRDDAAVLLTTFVLTVVMDLLVGIAAGMALSALIALKRVSEATALDTLGSGTTEPDDGQGADERAMDGAGEILTYRLSGAYLFTTGLKAVAAIERIGRAPRLLVFDMAAVPVMDTTAAHGLATAARRLHGQGTAIAIAGASIPVRKALLRAGLREPIVAYRATAAEARAILDD